MPRYKGRIFSTWRLSDRRAVFLSGRYRPLVPTTPDSMPRSMKLLSLALLIRQTGGARPRPWSQTGRRPRSWRCSRPSSKIDLFRRERDGQVFVVACERRAPDRLPTARSRHPRRRRDGRPRRAGTHHHQQPAPSVPTGPRWPGSTRPCARTPDKVRLEAVQLLLRSLDDATFDLLRRRRRRPRPTPTWPSSSTTALADRGPRRGGPARPPRSRRTALRPPEPTSSTTACRR